MFRASSEVHIELALYHAVVELAALFGAFAEELLELLMRRDDVALTASALAEDSAHFTVYLLSLAELEETLAVGRIADNNRILRLNELADVSLLDLHARFYASLVGVVESEGNSGIVDVEADSLEFCGAVHAVDSPATLWLIIA